MDELTRELIGVTYTHLVERMARAAFDADRTGEFLTIVERVCADCGIELLSQNLVDRLVDGFDDPFDQFLVRVEVNASALWQVGGWVELLGSLRRLFDPGSLTPPSSGHSVRLTPRRRHTRHPPTG